MTASRSPRSAGGTHDFFSEGDYWWPDPKNPAAPYLRRDGMTNPDNFVERRDALMRLSVEMPALTAAWKVTGRKKYAEHAARHLRAWFVDGAPRMNPHLEYAQAIHGRRHGRDVNANRRAVPRNGDGVWSRRGPNYIRTNSRLAGTCSTPVAAPILSNR
ncbi:MAG: alginate lyase family protein [Bryobacteraceae bacterium]|nr:alginate lyase family protein [Bryobacteraceae bacterium]